MKDVKTLSKDEYILIRTDQLMNNLLSNKNFIREIILDHFFNEVEKMPKDEFNNHLICNSSYLEEHLEKEGEC